MDFNSYYKLKKAIVSLPSKGFGARNVKAPGSKGGVGYWNGKGEWVYGTMPMGKYSTTSSSTSTPTIQRPNVDPVASTERLLLQDKKPWTFISGHHTSRNAEANHQMHNNLIREIQRRGYKPMPVTGYYTYQAKEPGGQGGVTQEPSYLVPEMGTKEAIELGNNYDQEAVLTHEGMFNVKTPTMYKVLSKKFIRGEIPKDQDQSVIEPKGGAKSTFLINTDWSNELTAPADYHAHLGKSFNNDMLSKSLSRPDKYMIAAEIIFFNKENKKKKNEPNRGSSN